MLRLIRRARRKHRAACLPVARRPARSNGRYASDSRAGVSPPPPPLFSLFQVVFRFFFFFLFYFSFCFTSLSNRARHRRWWRRWWRRPFHCSVFRRRDTELDARHAAAFIPYTTAAVPSSGVFSTVIAHRSNRPPLSRCRFRDCFIISVVFLFFIVVVVVVGAKAGKIGFLFFLFFLSYFQLVNFSDTYHSLSPPDQHHSQHTWGKHCSDK